MADRVEPSFIGRWLAPAGGPGAFAPTPAVICSGCGLGVGRTAILVREPGSGTALCPVCRLGWDPATPAGALVLAWLPEFAQGELNLLYTTLTLDVLRARQAGHEASAGIHWRGELLDSLYARAWSTQRHLPWTQHLSLLRDTLLALPDSERASALPVLAGLRYLPNPRHPPLGVFFRRLLTELDGTAD
jgi:hypothetical protein